jgi:hypothetical protein
MAQTYIGFLPCAIQYKLALNAMFLAILAISGNSCNFWQFLQFPCYTSQQRLSTLRKSSAVRRYTQVHWQLFAFITDH